MVNIPPAFPFTGDKFKAVFLTPLFQIVFNLKRSLHNRRLSLDKYGEKYYHKFANDEYMKTR